MTERPSTGHPHQGTESRGQGLLKPGGIVLLHKAQVVDSGLSSGTTKAPEASQWDRGRPVTPSPLTHEVHLLIGQLQSPGERELKLMISNVLLQEIPG